MDRFTVIAVFLAVKASVTVLCAWALLADMGMI
jgi:hypothetical protein